MLECSLVLARCSDLKYEHMLVLARARGFNARTRSVLGILMLDPSLLTATCCSNCFLFSKSIITNSLLFCYASCRTLTVVCSYFWTVRTMYVHIHYVWFSQIFWHFCKSITFSILYSKSTLELALKTSILGPKVESRGGSGQFFDLLGSGLLIFFFGQPILVLGHFGSSFFLQTVSIWAK